jgi:hypothetical protein
MKEVKRIANVGEKIKILVDQRDEWGRLLYKAGTVLTVKEVLIKESRPSGLIFPKEKNERGDITGTFPDEYVVLEEEDSQ